MILSKLTLNTNCFVFRQKRLIILFLLGIFLSSFLYLTSKVYYQRLAAFGCSDQCFNFVAAYFMQKGKILYSEIFFNHQPLMAYLSFLIQKILPSSSLFQLIASHRAFIIFFSLVMSFIFIYRFKWVGLGFVLLYESTKYYFFGSLFLPEAIVAYLITFLFGLTWLVVHCNKLTLIDLLTSALFTWTIIFLRTPFIPLALFLFILILLKSKGLREQKIALLFFISLTLITLYFLPLKDYFFQVFTLNSKTTVVDEINSNGTILTKLLAAFAQPILIITSRGNWTFLRNILIALDLIFVTAIIFYYSSKKTLLPLILIIFSLGLAALRPIAPGTTFYQAFHMLPWHALFTLITLLLIKGINKNKRYQKISFLLAGSFLLLFAYSLHPKKSFLWEKINKEEEFTVNYAHPFAYGETIKTLSEPNDNLFLEQWDDLIYWQSQLDSSYKYSLYTPIMTGFKDFQDAKIDMFRLNPPDFYYAYCDDKRIHKDQLPLESKNDYQYLGLNGKPSCLFIKKDKIAKIDEWKKEKIKDFGFTFPSNP